MTFDELRSKTHICRNAFETTVRDSFGQSIRQNLFDVCDEGYQHLQEVSDQATMEKSVIDTMLMELRLIVV